MLIAKKRSKPAPKPRQGEVTDILHCTKAGNVFLDLMPKKRTISMVIKYLQNGIATVTVGGGGAIDVTATLFTAVMDTAIHGR